MNATFDGARIHQQELDHEIESIRAERLINERAGHRPGPVARGLASVGRGLVSVGTVLASRVEAPAGQSADVGGRA
jgi:hypothetical protein